MRRSYEPNRADAFAITAPGLETLCAGELASLGLRGRVVPGGVAWRGDLRAVAAANLWLRTASRVVVRVAEFRATAFFELELAAKRIPWERFVGARSTIRFRVTCRKSKLYHSDAVAQRLAEAVSRSVPGVTVETERAERGGGSADADESPAGPIGPGDAHDPPQLFIVRLLHDVCSVSADTSGALLHMRGYRQELAKAPLRETIAAAMLLAAEWRVEAPLADPMCGSGTIPIEAARIARRIAPGRDRRFALLDWPEFDSATWRGLVDDACAAELPRAPALIVGSDRDRGAIDAARRNAERGGVAGDVEFRVAPISALAPHDPPGWIVSNPPYGVRVGDRARLRDLYARLGAVLRARREGWTVALLLADRRAAAEVGLELRERFSTTNGGIPVRLDVATVPALAAR